MKIFSFDAETNGLYGEAFALAAVVTGDDGQEIASFVASCPISSTVNDWVRDNVLPHLQTLEVSHTSYRDMLEVFYAFYMLHKEGSTVVAHIAHPVETKVLRDMVEADLAGRVWTAPFPLVDVVGVLLAKGFDPTSVDSYNKANAVSVPFAGVTHHPLYDSWAAERCFRHLMSA